MENFQRLSLDDIIFSGRNQTYGGYMLRRKYAQRLVKGAVIGVTIASLLLAEPIISEKIFGIFFKEKEKLVYHPVEILPPPPLDPLKPPPPPPPVRPQLTFTPPIVTEREVPKEQPPIPPAIPENIDIGTKNIAGDQNVKTYVAPVEVAPPPPPIETHEEKPKVEPIMNIGAVEQKPEFPNGEAAMFKFLHDKIKYPSVAIENNIQGTVYISFVVNTDGSITDVKILRAVAGGCSEEAARVVGSMPKWSPGRQQGRAVRVAYTLPVKFYLAN